ncbi:6.7K ORF [Barley yellow dwarf virus-PAV]|uniref:Uncharacterized protein ORF6 n=1 Tax=Barley yellow dwarf virus (isolate PAV) TaxID=2169986 RepID=ORF6_BYDVP|nr:P6 protein [Barley yellow dwarf virus PAV]P09517.1 RecName: Full=Uncharacterized protein ORF6 [Barley yellow dwarf virus PAV]pir/S00951/ hypothetical protein, 6.7K - barley yellow dwarf virus [Barley yellow dwarf virus]CAA30496.1 6.7K ORF [Barley yellow dwarf virus PAV]
MEDLHVIAVCILALTVLSGVGAVLSCCRWCCSNPFPPSLSSVQAKDSRSVRETIKNIEGASAQ